MHFPLINMYTSIHEHKENSMVVVLFVDLQKVLLAPAFNASAFYYKTKLCCYNYTIYDTNTYDALCYLWNETAIDLTANTFACLLIDYLVSKERCQAADTIIIYSDGCTYQNRCVQLSKAMFFFAMKYNKKVIQQYLVRDHTQMEVDSVHALIERSVWRKYIYTPACYIGNIPIIKMAKKKGPFYKVKYHDHTFFHDFSDVDYYSSIRPGRLSGDSKVVNISQLKYNNEGLFYRLEYTELTRIGS